MKKWSLIMLLCLSFLSCMDKKDLRILGDWRVNNRFYQASYQIANTNGKLVGKVMQYNDGTTKYQWDNKNPRYLFKNLTSKDGVFVDGYSGATMKTDGFKIQIQVLHEDTLNTTLFTNHHPTSEIWIRKK